MQRLGKSILLGAIRLYQLSFSAILGRQCRFLPTCSNYASEAIQTYGIKRGGALAFRRLCRCHPWKKLGGSSGYDPVP